MKKFLSVICMAFCLLFFSSTANAGRFNTLAMTGWLQLGNDQAWEESYKTDEGKFKIRFRKLLFGSDAKRYHLIIWWNGKRIADGYSPEGQQYAFKIFEDSETKRIFVMLQTRQRAVLMGYEPNNQKLEKYIDSKDYYSNLPYPSMNVDSDGDLQLSFSDNVNGVGPIRYKFIWNKDVNWFGYQNVSINRSRSVSEWEDDSDEDYDYGGEYESSADEIVEAPTDTGKSSDELYYEMEEVVGS